MSEQITNDLIGILRIKKGLFADMLMSVRKVSELLAGDDVEALDGQIQHCEEIMHMVDELCDTEKRLQAAGAVDNTDVKQLKNEIEHIIKQISDANIECTKASEEKLKSYGSQIKALNQTKQGKDVYSGQASVDAVFIDAKQ